MAIAKLEREALVALNEAEAAELIGSDRSSAEKIFKLSVARLEQQKEQALNQSIGSWNGTAEMRLENLNRLSKSAARFRPFLVRTMVVHEGTGAFTLRKCGNSLFISHVSLGAAGTPIRLPMVLFLADRPHQIYVATGLAR